MDILSLEANQIASAVSKGELTAEKVTESFLNHAKKINPSLNSMVAWNDACVTTAKDIDTKKNFGKLAGVPVAIKDMLSTRGLSTTASSKILKGYVPPYDSTVVARLKQAGAVVIGKANQDEFAMGSSSETSVYGNTKNPWNLDCVPGGSSGGSAAAVAARQAPFSIGTDTGGSIRQPASFCGIVGVKPTYGRVSRYGIIAFASSLDQAGPMALSVKDAALVMEVISGHDGNDSTTAQIEVPKWSENLNSNLKGMKVGLVKEFMANPLDADTDKVFQNSLKILKDAGAEVVEVSIPLISMAVPIYYLVATSEASSNLARYDGVRFGYRANFDEKAAEDIADFYSRTRGEGFGPEVKRRIILGTYCLSSGYYDAYYKKACQVRRLLRDQYLKAFSQCDVLMSPVTTHPAFKIGEKISDPLQMYMNDIFTTSTNLVGIPGMSVPGGFSSSGLPIGIQLKAAHFQEQKMLNVALAIEEKANTKGTKPNVIK